MNARQIEYACRKHAQKASGRGHRPEEMILRYLADVFDEVASEDEASKRISDAESKVSMAREKLSRAEQELQSAHQPKDMKSP